MLDGREDRDRDVKHFDPAAVLETVVGQFWRPDVASTGSQGIATDRVTEAGGFVRHR